MKSLVSRFSIVIALLVTSVNSYSQKCNCESTKKCLYKNKSINICGYELGSFNREKIITEFTLFSKDSILINNLHNEGASFLFQAKEDKIIITEIELQIENGKYIFPENFSCVSVHMKNGKAVLSYSEVKARPIVDHLKKNFKTITELY